MLVLTSNNRYCKWDWTSARICPGGINATGTPPISQKPELFHGCPFARCREGGKRRYHWPNVSNICLVSSLILQAEFHRSRCTPASHCGPTSCSMCCPNSERNSDQLSLLVRTPKLWIDPSPSTGSGLRTFGLGSFVAFV